VKLLDVAINNHGDMLRLLVVDKTKKVDDSKRLIEVRANLLPVLNFIMDKLKDKNWKEISGRKPKWDYPRLELDEFKKMLEGKV
jgi:hypothetical protein